MRSGRISCRRNHPPLLKRLDHQLHGVGQILLAGINLEFGGCKSLKAFWKGGSEEEVYKAALSG